MITKDIDLDGFTKAEIVKLYDEEGTILCNLSNETCTEKNISFDWGYWPFELSAEELKDLCPEPNINIPE